MAASANPGCTHLTAGGGSEDQLHQERVRGADRDDPDRRLGNDSAVMIKIGTSGFSFKDWRGSIYPENLQSKDNLIYYQQKLGFNCVEINATYYTLLSEKSFAGMESKTGDDFEFVVKALVNYTDSFKWFSFFNYKFTAWFYVISAMSVYYNCAISFIYL